MKTEVKELADSRVRIDVTVDHAAVRKAVDRAARQMAGDLNIPGFRKGKVPPHFVIQRLGWSGVAEEAIRVGLGDWYEQALMATALNPVGEPNISGIDELPTEGQDLTFAIEIGVLPKAKLGPYRELDVSMPPTEPTEAQIDAELDRLRLGFGKLETIDRPIETGDLVTVDYEATVDGEPLGDGRREGHLFDLSSPDLPAELAAEFPGHVIGDEFTLDVEVGDDDEDATEDQIGKTAVYEIKVNEVRALSLPDFDDEFAAMASEFETMDELRDEIRNRMAPMIEDEAQREFKSRVIIAAVGGAEVDLTEELVHARAHEMWERFEGQLRNAGIDPGAYFDAQGKSRHDLINEHHDDAEASLKRDAVLTAIADAENLEPSDEQMLLALGVSGSKAEGDKLMRDLRETGRDTIVRGQVRLQLAADLIAESAQPIPDQDGDDDESEGGEDS